MVFCFFDYFLTTTTTHNRLQIFTIIAHENKRKPRIYAVFDVFARFLVWRRRRDLNYIQIAYLHGFAKI